jgi:hypothetical protein
VEVILQRHGTYDDPNAITEETIICKAVRKVGDGYEFFMQDGSKRIEPGENCDVAVVMEDGTLKPVGR